MLDVLCIVLLKVKPVRGSPRRFRRSQLAHRRLYVKHVSRCKDHAIEVLTYLSLTYHELGHKRGLGLLLQKYEGGWICRIDS
jgi:hypothetical protein